MKVRLLVVTQRQPQWVLDGCAEYAKRLPRPWQFATVELKPAARTSGAVADRVQALEAERILRAVPDGALLVALDERGSAWSTRQFAARLDDWRQRGRDLCFVIGGADGLDPALRARADERLSLSPLTMPHGLARVVLLEQLYRATTVLDGHPYHK